MSLQAVESVRSIVPEILFLLRTEVGGPLSVFAKDEVCCETGVNIQVDGKVGSKLNVRTTNRAHTPRSAQTHLHARF